MASTLTLEAPEPSELAWGGLENRTQPAKEAGLDLLHPGGSGEPTVLQLCDLLGLESHPQDFTVAFLNWSLRFGHGGLCGKGSSPEASVLVLCSLDLHPGGKD